MYGLVALMDQSLHVLANPFMRLPLRVYRRVLYGERAAGCRRCTPDGSVQPTTLPPIQTSLGQRSMKTQPCGPARLAAEEYSLPGPSAPLTSTPLRVHTPRQMDGGSRRSSCRQELYKGMKRPDRDAVFPPQSLACGTTALASATDLRSLPLRKF